MECSSGSVGSGVIDAFHSFMELFGGSGVVALLLCIVRIHGVKLCNLESLWLVAVVDDLALVAVAVAVAWQI